MVLAVATALSATCAGPSHVFTACSRMTPSEVELISPSSGRAAGDVLVIADTHASNPFSRHATMSDNVDFSDTLVTHVAVRPTQMDMWGPSLLRGLLERNQDVTLIVHLGDVANMACGSEFARFAAVMRGQERPWVLAPGNHDSLMMGNWGEDSFEGPYWAEACRQPNDEVDDDHMNKNDFIEAYAAAQGWELPPRPDAAACGDLDVGRGPVERVQVCEDPDHRTAHDSCSRWRSARG